MWLSVIEMLKLKEQLPVVAFTFSKKKCDDNATQLTSTDLTTTSEKSEIHVFVHKCVARLKGTDKQLPQVGTVNDLMSAHSLISAPPKCKIFEISVPPPPISAP